MELTVKKDYLIFDLTKATTRDGRPYLRMVLSDEGKLINAIMFDISKLNFEPSKGDIALISAVLQHYNNLPQLKVSEMEFVSAGGNEAFLPKSKNKPEVMEEELKRLITKHVTNKWLINIIEQLYMDNSTWVSFLKAPAAKSMHHAYIHGLLEHTLGVVKNASELAKLYPYIDKSLVVTGALFHDIGKIYEIETSAGFDYSTEGRLLGHLMLGYSLVSSYMNKVDGFPELLKQHLLHLIASHHGTLEFGSPQVPKTAEALLLNFADDIDAKLNAFDQVLEKESVEPGGWSNYDRLLERQIYLPKAEDFE